MKTTLLFPLVSLLLALPPALPTARAQFPTFPAADKVLGAPDLVTRGSAANSPSGINSPIGVAIDPLTGKVFVASGDQNRILRFANASSLANGANAEAVFGQLNFSGTSEGSTAPKFYYPCGIHVDAQGRLWVADSDNHRVLMFQGAATFVGLPDLVLGQPNFTTVTDAASTTKMRRPQGVFVDAADNLWVADSGNHRVLKFEDVSSLSNGAAASVVLGQPDFSTANQGTSAEMMAGPASAVVDATGRLWVSDEWNNRVLRFDNAATLGNGAAANGVLGQPDFTTSTAGLSATNLHSPRGVITDSAGTLYVSDLLNNRILFYKNPAAKSNGAAAEGVLGQPDFTTNSVPTTPTDRTLNRPEVGLVFDANGALWVADSYYNRVLRFSPDRFAAPPVVQGKVPKSTSKSSLALRGSASDPGGVAQVRFRVGKGAFKTAGGTTSWRFTAKLKPGRNTIEIVTVDTLGNTSLAKKVTVTRQ
jgi:sugar lactone lactonase YvrE